VATLRFLGNPTPWSGEKVKVNVKISKSTTQGSFDGFDTFNTNRVNNRKQMEFSPKGFYHNVTLDNMSVSVNNTPDKILDLIQVEMDSAQQDMADGLGDIMYGDGTGNGGKDLTGLDAAVDDGTSVASYGGLSRATYATLQADVTLALGNLTLTAMATAYDAAAKGSDRPTIIFTTEGVWGFYEQLLQPTVVANYDAGGFAKVTRTGEARGGLSGEIGFDALYYRGVPMVKDEKCTTGFMYFLNEKYIKWHSLPHVDNILKSDGGSVEGVYTMDEKTPVFSWTGFKKPVNQDAIVGQFIAYGELINHNPNRSSKIEGITNV